MRSNKRKKNLREVSENCSWAEDIACGRTWEAFSPVFLRLRYNHGQSYQRTPRFLRRIYHTKKVSDDFRPVPIHGFLTHSAASQPMASDRLRTFVPCRSQQCAFSSLTIFSDHSIANYHRTGSWGSPVAKERIVTRQSASNRIPHPHLRPCLRPGSR